MSADSTPDFAAVQTLDALYPLLDRIGVKNGWAKPTPSLYPAPKCRFQPARWRYGEARAALDAAGRLVATEWAERRNLILANPIPDNDYPTVTTMVAAYQMVKAGEAARSHRHTPNALRVVIEAGPKTFTIIDGERVPMMPGDVLLTPMWCYHGHANDSARDAFWIDVLDAPLVQLLDPMFLEHHPDGLEAGERIAPAHPMRFAFADYRPCLLSQPAEQGVRRLAFGPPTLPTCDQTAVAIAAGACWICPRSTASSILIVVEGSGRSTIGDGPPLDWGVGDVIAAPNWHEQRHRSEAGAILISVSDAPVLEKLGWLRAFGEPSLS